MTSKDLETIFYSVIMIIKDLKAREILDSRGQPTVEVDLYMSESKGGSKVGRASVPSGASVGAAEACELRDNTDRYLGRGVQAAVNNVNTRIRTALVGKNFSSQEKLDELLIELDGTQNKSSLGANALLATSLAFAKAKAKVLGKQLFQSLDIASRHAMPVPMFNILNGGAHADNGLDFQEFMIVPQHASGIKNNLEMAYKIFFQLKKILKNQGLNINVGDEGGLAPAISSPIQALDLLMAAIDQAGYVAGTDVAIALDIAANEFFRDQYYIIAGEGEKLDSVSLIDYYGSLVDSYPIISIEDPIAEADLEGWKLITEKLGSKIQLVGDDLFVTNAKILLQGINNSLANAILIKMNQVGTLTETLNTIRLARQHDYTYIISHRSGETEETAMSHLAVAAASKYIKAGSLCRTDRVCKYNELLRISEALAQ